MIDAKLTRRAFLGLAGTATLAACGGGGGGGKGDGDVSIIMVTNGGVYDQSFNELSWAGLQRLAADTGWKVSYIESKQESEYLTNLDKAVDTDANLIWSIGFPMAEAIKKTAEENPEAKFAGIEVTNDLGYDNLTGSTSSPRSRRSPSATSRLACPSPARSDFSAASRATR